MQTRMHALTHTRVHACTEAWRLLGETTLLLQQPGRSAAAYGQAVALDSDSLSILTGYADACIANGQQSKAVDTFNKLRVGQWESVDIGVCGQCRSVDNDM